MKDRRMKIRIMAFSTLLLLVFLGLWGWWQGSRLLGCRVIAAGQKAQLCRVQLPAPENLSLTWQNIELPQDAEKGMYCLPQKAGAPLSGNLALWAEGEKQELYLVKEEWAAWQEAMKTASPLTLYAVKEGEWFPLQVLVTGLPVLEITTSDPAETLTGDARGSMELFWPAGQDVKAHYQTSSILYHVRGNSSLAFNKKNYKMELLDEYGNPRDLNLLNLREDDDWRLASLAEDETLCKERAVCRLWNQIAGEYGYPQTNVMEYLEL